MIKYKCTSCNKDYSNIIHEEFKKRFQNTFEFSNNINTFILLLQKVFNLNKYMDEWESLMKLSKIEILNKINSIRNPFILKKRKRKSKIA